MEFEEKSTGIAQHRSGFVSPPKGGGGSTTILTNGLELRAFLVSHSGRHDAIEAKIIKTRPCQRGGVQEERKDNI